MSSTLNFIYKIIVNIIKKMLIVQIIIKVTRLWTLLFIYRLGNAFWGYMGFKFYIAIRPNKNTDNSEDVFSLTYMRPINFESHEKHCIRFMIKKYHA